ncbi:Hypothetical predicted protein [Pelobates cultripes]|uniref:Uncharacterized protein n=1 Tax=Pelobates cultripes TaxID=61616 RepID=A0AAD1T010_PELCU|nr:Hypothetical predicted protein [Pelobates cultripes]
MDQLNSEEFHSLLDATMTKSVTQAIVTAMGAMSETLTQSISNAILASSSHPSGLRPMAQPDKPVPLSGRKATEKTHHMGKHTSKNSTTDRIRPVTTEDVGPPCKRATHRAKAMRTWKWEKAQTETSDSGSDIEEVMSESEEIGSLESGNSSPERSLAVVPA